MTLHETKLQAAPAVPTVPAEHEAGGTLTIDLAAIEANWRRLYGMTIPVECAAVVKANAYGCGLEQVAARLLKVRCTTFFVADIAEGRRLRTVAPEAVIYVLNGVLPNTPPALAEARLRPVINSTTELAEWDTFVASNNWQGGAALHIDTGMNRLGLTLEESVAVALRVQSANHGFSLLMSHLACADTPDHPMNDKQIRLFREIQILFRGVSSSLANSAGIFLGSTAHCDLVRPGIALFGANPMPGRPNPMRPVIELKGRIIQVRGIKKGDTVGYGASWTAARPSRLAIVAAGYGDGYLRSAGAAKGKAPAPVSIAGKRCPIVGRISMDLLAVDVTDIPEGQVRRGDMATLIGTDLNIDELAAACGTIGYELLTNLGSRYHRVYRG
ncbi:MAG: alanine racemase [Xanthobacteraceae bacterium]